MRGLLIYENVTCLHKCPHSHGVLNVMSVTLIQHTSHQAFARFPPASLSSSKNLGTYLRSAVELRSSIFTPAEEESRRQRRAWSAKMSMGE